MLKKISEKKTAFGKQRTYEDFGYEVIVYEMEGLPKEIFTEPIRKLDNFPELLISPQGECMIDFSKIGNVLIKNIPQTIENIEKAKNLAIEIEENYQKL